MEGTVAVTLRPLYIGQRALGDHWIRGLVGPRGGVDFLRKKTRPGQSVFRLRCHSVEGYVLAFCSFSYSRLQTLDLGCRSLCTYWQALVGDFFKVKRWSFIVSKQQTWREVKAKAGNSSLAVLRGSFVLGNGLT